jgi:hypothetical protein
VRGLQALKFLFHDCPRIAHLRQQVHDLRRVGVGERASLFQDRGPGAPHKEQPVTLGQNALRSIEHPAEVITDQLLGGNVGRAAHASIIPRKRANVESRARAEPRLDRTGTH